MHCCCQISFCKQINLMLLKYRFRPASCFPAKCFDMDDRCMRGDRRKIHIGRNASLFFVQPSRILNANVCLAISMPLSVESSCLRLKRYISTTNCITNFAIKIDIDFELLLRLVGCINLIISYHWINYKRHFLI